MGKIYRTLEYNTIGFDDIKEKWYITDPGFNRLLFNKFIGKNQFRRNNKPVSLEAIDSVRNFLYDGKVLPYVKRRYADTEIDTFAFFLESEINKSEPKPLFDPVSDAYFLKGVVGETTYDKIKSKDYIHYNVTKKEFIVRRGYYLNVNANFLEPEVMFWQATTQRFDKYLLSAFGKWGNDYISLPGWYAGDYVAGVKLTYLRDITAPMDSSSYSISLGGSFKTRRPVEGERLDKDLFVGGNSLYFKLTGNPLPLFKFIFGNNAPRNFELSVEGKITYDEFKKSKYKARSSMDFYTVNNYFNVNAKFFKLGEIKIFDLFSLGQLEAGAGFAVPDINHYEIILEQPNLIDLDSNKTKFNRFEHYAVLELGVSNTEGAFQHHINIMANWNFQKKYGYVGVRGQFMLTDIFGIDLRFYQNFDFRDPRFPPWRAGSYFVFSPVLRINH